MKSEGNKAKTIRKNTKPWFWLFPLFALLFLGTNLLTNQQAARELLARSQTQNATPTTQTLTNQPETLQAPTQRSLPSEPTQNAIIFKQTKDKTYYQQHLRESKNLNQINNQTQVYEVTVPHHLLAADIIAKTLKQLENNTYQTIIILSPDHFTRGKSKITTANAPLKTTVTTSQINQENATQLTNVKNVQVNNNIFSEEHGIASPLPFAQTLWPNAKITPILIRSDAKPEDLNQLSNWLKKQSQTPETLIIESSDFSHYITEQEANKKDQETINTLQTSTPENILTLHQPDNCDSINILYLIKKLQTDTNTNLEFFINKNSQAYTNAKVQETTSYITFYLSKNKFTLTPDNQAIIFTGDLFTGRNNLQNYRNPSYTEQKAKEITQTTKNLPLIINLEGYLTKTCQETEKLKLCMEEENTIPLLKKINVIAASLANNHTKDNGNTSYQQTKKEITKNQIKTLENQQTTTIQIGKNKISILSLTDIDPIKKRPGALYKTQLEKTLTEFEKQKPDQLKIIYIHWGNEYTQTPSNRETQIIQQITTHHIPIIIGSHSHQGSAPQYQKDQVIEYSLGNFIFDQPQNEDKKVLLKLQFLETRNYIITTI